MSLVDVQDAAPPVALSVLGDHPMVAAILVHRGKCMMLFAPSADPKLRYLSCPGTTSRFIAALASIKSAVARQQENPCIRAADSLAAFCVGRSRGLSFFFAVFDVILSFGFWLVGMAIDFDLFDAATISGQNGDKHPI